MYLILIIIAFLFLYTFLTKRDNVTTVDKFVCISIFFLTVFQLYIFSIILGILLIFNLTTPIFNKIKSYFKRK